MRCLRQFVLSALLLQQLLLLMAVEVWCLQQGGPQYAIAKAVTCRGNAQRSL